MVGIVMIDCDKKKDKKIKSFYEIPSAFWNEYNTIILDIYYMTLANCESIKYKIDDFEYKYSQTIDQQLYNDKMSEILRNYKTKKQLLIIKNQ